MIGPGPQAEPMDAVAGIAAGLRDDGQVKTETR